MFRHIAHNATSLTFAAIGALLLSAGVNPARAQENARYVAAIPFEFGIDNAVFPAGTYQFTPLSQHMLRLDLVGGKRTAFMLSFSAEDATRTHMGELRFAQYGNRYFLQEFSAPDKGEGWHAVSRCTRSTNEKRVAKEWTARAHTRGGVDIALNAVDQH